MVIFSKYIVILIFLIEVVTLDYKLTLSYLIIKKKMTNNFSVWVNYVAISPHKLKKLYVCIKKII